MDIDTMVDNGERLIPKAKNVLVVDTAHLSDKVMEASLHDPLLHRLVWMLCYGEGFDATELISQVLVLQSQTNRELLQKCVKLSMYAPMTLTPPSPSSFSPTHR